MKVPAFLWQASIFERFIYGRGVGAKATPKMMYQCLSRRFRLRPQEGAEHRFMITAYLEYLASAKFLHRENVGRDTGPYYVHHDQMSMSDWTPVETRFEGELAVSRLARGTGPLKQWNTKWPRWRGVMGEAEQILAGSPHRDLLMQALDGLSPMSPSGTPITGPRH